MTRARSLANRASDIVSVRDFGAVGDGVADDAAAFTAAFASGKSIDLGGRNYTYRIASFVKLPDQSLSAEKPYRMIGNGAMVFVDSFAYAPFTSESFANNPALTTNVFAGKLFVSGIDFKGVGTDGVFDCDHIYNLQVTNCHFDGLARVFTSSRAKPGHANGYIQSLFVSNCIFTDISQQIIKGKEAYNVVFDNNQCEDCGAGVFLDGTDVYAINTIRITKNLFEGGGLFVRCTSTLAGEISGNYLEENISGDTITAKCHMDLTYDTVAVGGSNPSTWLIASNSSQDNLSQRNDVAFGMVKINGSYDTVSVLSNWANSAVTVSPIRTTIGNYSRRFQKYVVTKSPTEVGATYISSVLNRPLSYSLVSGNRLQIITFDLDTDVIATDFRSVVLDCSVRLQVEVPTGEVFGECAFDLKIMLSPYGSGIPSAKGKPTYWDVKVSHTNYIEQAAGTAVDTTVSANTVSMFPSGITSWNWARSGNLIHIQAIGFSQATIPAPYGQVSNVRAHIVGQINALSKLDGTAANWATRLIN